MDVLSRIVDIITLPFRYIFWITIVSALLLFSPDSWLRALHVKVFSEKYGLVIGIIFFASVILTIINAVIWVGNKVRVLSQQHAYKNQILDDIQSLGNHEKSVLREFFLHDRQTLRLPIDEPTVAGLIGRGILERVGTLGERSLAGMVMPVRISKVVRDNLTASMIDLPTGKPTEEQIRDLLQKRPDFAPTLEHHERLFHRADIFLR